jgi:tetratricopeptide (TPR) repeat protein
MPTNMEPLGVDAQIEAGLASLRRRVLHLLIVIPIIVIVGLAVVLGIFASRLTGRLESLEEHTTRLRMLEETRRIDRIFSQTTNFEWAIDRYADVVTGRLADTGKPWLESKLRLAGLYMKREDPKSLLKAEEILREAVKGHEAYWGIRSMLAYVYFLQHRERDAIQEAQAAIELNPLDSDALNNAAWMLATAQEESLRDFKKAELYAVKANELSDYRSLEYLDTLAEVYERQRNSTKALEIVKRATRQESGTPLEQLLKRRDRLEKTTR